MGHKLFQDFAHVMCQKFVESPSNQDLVNLVILGEGVLELEILEQKAAHNQHSIEPLPFALSWLKWVRERMAHAAIPDDQLVGASLTVEYSVNLYRKQSLGWLCGSFTLSCSALVAAPDRKYIATLQGQRDWGLSCV